MKGKFSEIIKTKDIEQDVIGKTLEDFNSKCRSANVNLEKFNSEIKERFEQEKKLIEYLQIRVGDSSFNEQIQ
jgi:hypothetical protein